MRSEQRGITVENVSSQPITFGGYKVKGGEVQRGIPHSFRPTIENKPSLIIIDDGSPRQKGNSGNKKISGPPVPDISNSIRGEGFVTIFAACDLGSTGGGQRPAGMASEFRQFIPTIYLFGATKPRVDSGILLSSPLRHKEIAEQLNGIESGFVLNGLPNYSDMASYFDCPVLYDYYDDWDAFVEEGHAKNVLVDKLEDTIKNSDIIICSARPLIQKAIEYGAKKTIMVHNAARATRPIVEHFYPDDMLRGDINAIYLGSTWGKWLDWDAVDKLAKDLQEHNGVINIIGGEKAADISYDNVRWFREKPWQQAMRYVACSHVGIAPFKNRDISASADIIKYYDYVSAGCSMVATDVLEEMEGRDYSITTKPDDMIEGVLEAREIDIPYKEMERFVKENNWRARCKKIIEAVEDYF